MELILLPRWFPVHLSKMSYWARTVIVPLLVLQALKPLARNPRGVHIAELFRRQHGRHSRARSASKPLLVGVFPGAGPGAQTGRTGLAEEVAPPRHRRLREIGRPNG